MQENHYLPNKAADTGNFDPTFFFIAYRSSHLSEENYKYESITIKLIEVKNKDIINKKLHKFFFLF